MKSLWTHFCEPINNNECWAGDMLFHRHFVSDKLLLHQYVYRNADMFREKFPNLPGFEPGIF